MATTLNLVIELNICLENYINSTTKFAKYAKTVIENVVSGVCLVIMSSSILSPFSVSAVAAFSVSSTTTM